MVRLSLLIFLIFSACVASEPRSSSRTPAPQQTPQVRPPITPTTTRKQIAELVAPTLSSPSPPLESRTASPLTEMVSPCDLLRTPSTYSRPPVPIHPCTHAARIPILEYHDTEFDMKPTIQMKTEWFLAQMEWLYENGYGTLTGEELQRFVRGEVRPPQRSVVLRFDIGLPAYENYTKVIVPSLERYGFHAIFFVLTRAVKDECVDDYLCWSQLREWVDAGLIEVGSHGVDHPDYQKLKPDQRERDALESKQQIESKLGLPVLFFAFPYDSVPDRPGALLKPLGYELGFAGYRSERSVLFNDPNPYALPAYYVYSGEKTYPVITGTGGLTFGEMIDQAVAQME